MIYVYVRFTQTFYSLRQTDHVQLVVNDVIVVQRVLDKNEMSTCAGSEHGR